MNQITAKLDYRKKENKKNKLPTLDEAESLCYLGTLEANGATCRRI